MQPKYNRCIRQLSNTNHFYISFMLYYNVIFWIFSYWEHLLVFVISLDVSPFPKHSQPSVPMGFTSTDSTNHGSKTLKNKKTKNSRKASKSKTLICCVQATVHSNLQSIYTVLGILSNLEAIKSKWEDVCGLYANTMPFSVRDLSVPGFW